VLTYIPRSELDAIVVKPQDTVPTKHVAFPLRRRHLLEVEGHHHPRLTQQRCGARHSHGCTVRVVIMGGEQLRPRSLHLGLQRRPERHPIEPTALANKPKVLGAPEATSQSTLRFVFAFSQRTFPALAKRYIFKAVCIDFVLVHHQKKI
jgi:hypothetical protein